ncbi:hypothetical protein LF817_19935 [Halobacillus sp. A1]|uniref:hypothetical protein n=1 Tax=Halobacillus sp. A1 TaxID=2880262 RepID=UPI0020A6A7AC|nr:hypothetical protein [Halobacillus sp. A1]MCP3033594.1 hypothetical protein [Halobacillus sp. A1]
MTQLEDIYNTYFKDVFLYVYSLLIIAYELSHLCGVLSHSVRTIEPVNAGIKATLLNN